MASKLLLVDDDRFLLQNLKTLLVSHGYEVRTAISGEAGISEVAALAPDMMVLDIGLPDMDGIAVCRRIRSKWHFPILMLTARSDAMDKVIGLEVGADDYLTKPFEPFELLARVRAHLRRAGEYTSDARGNDTHRIGELVIDPGSRDAILDGRACGLTNREFEIIEKLAANVGRAVNRDALAFEDWGLDLSFNSNSLDVHIYRLRKKIERDPKNAEYIHTVKGFGFKLEHIPVGS